MGSEFYETYGFELEYAESNKEYFDLIQKISQKLSKNRKFANMDSSTNQEEDQFE